MSPLSRRRRRYRDQKWHQAQALLEEALQQDAASLELGRVERVGRGLCRDAYIAEATLRPDPQNRSGRYVALLLRRDAAAECAGRMEHEAKVLAQLEGLELPIRVPRLVALRHVDEDLAMVETAVAGGPLEFFVGQSGSLDPLQVVAEVAAAVHAIEPDKLRDLPGQHTRRGHAEAAVAVCEGLKEPVIAELSSWAREHLPPEEPAVVLHGDLLPQNIRIELAFGEDPRVGLIDWECTRLGDPAYDLAIVTRGVRRPLKTPGGTRRLIDAYCEASGNDVALSAVRIYELCLFVSWYRAALEAGRGSRPAAEQLRLLAGLFRRAVAGS